MQNVPLTKPVSRWEKSVYKFHDEKIQYTTSLTKKMSKQEQKQHAITFIKKISFTRSQINMYQVSWTKSASPKLHEQKLIYKFNKEKNHYVTSFMNKTQHATSFTKKSARNKFHEEKSERSKFHEENKFHEEKKSLYKFHEEREQHTASLTTKNQHAISSTNKNQTQ